MDTPLPLVSAIVITHNRLPLLLRAIESIRNQTYNNIEIIVIDDASTDGTYNYLTKESGLHYIYISKDNSKGGNHARNIGIIRSKGKYVAFLDDDDYWLPSKIEKQVDLIEKKRNGFVYCGRITEIVHSNGCSYKESLPDEQLCGDVSKKVLLTNCVSVSSGMLVKKEVLEQVGMFDEKLKCWQDYELSIRLAQVTPFYYVNEPLFVYRKNDTDPHRLTNAYHIWKEAVAYIKVKHGLKYRSLSTRERFVLKLILWQEAEQRCFKSGYKIRSGIFKIKRKGVIAIWKEIRRWRRLS